MYIRHTKITLPNDRHVEFGVEINVKGSKKAFFYMTANGVEYRARNLRIKACLKVIYQSLVQEGEYRQVLRKQRRTTHEWMLLLRDCLLENIPRNKERLFVPSTFVNSAILDQLYDETERK